MKKAGLLLICGFLIIASTALAETVINGDLHLMDGGRHPRSAS
jgi:hypothetical protein